MRQLQLESSYLDVGGFGNADVDRRARGGSTVPSPVAGGLSRQDGGRLDRPDGGRGVGRSDRVQVEGRDHSAGQDSRRGSRRWSTSSTRTTSMSR